MGDVESNLKEPDQHMSLEYVWRREHGGSQNRCRLRGDHGAIGIRPTVRSLRGYYHFHAVS